MTFSKLKEMVSTFVGEQYGYFTPTKTYIFAPECPKATVTLKGNVYISTGKVKGQHAELNMLEKCGTTKEFYITRSPCSKCSMELYNKYKGQTEKPTIYIARQAGKTNQEKEDFIKCNAMLVKDGFTLVPWDMSDFDKYLTDQSCENVITGLKSSNIVGKPGKTTKCEDLFKKRFKETKVFVDIVKNRAADGNNYYQICKDIINKMGK